MQEPLISKQLGSGNDLYLPSIDVIPAQLGAAYTTAEKNVVYYFDFRDGSIIPTVTNGQSGINKGLVEIVVSPKQCIWLQWNPAWFYFERWQPD
ncbi:MAG: hypothetical protein R2784_19845 [Saprospiraceae bacterium]